MDKIHRLIRTMYKVSHRRAARDNMPISCRHGGRDRLGDICYELGFNKCVEVGVHTGKFSQILCEKNPHIELTCIDPWKGGDKSHNTQDKQDRIFKRAINRLTPFNARILRKTSMNALVDFEDASLDFVYIDGNHHFDFVCPDIIYWSRKLKRGGIMACHDYFHHRNGGVVVAVDAYIAGHNITPWYVTYEIMPSAFWVRP